jgi:hypothetical protein
MSVARASISGVLEDALGEPRKSLASALIKDFGARFEKSVGYGSDGEEKTIPEAVFPNLKSQEVAEDEYKYKGPEIKLRDNLQHVAVAGSIAAYKDAINAPRDSACAYAQKEMAAIKDLRKFAVEEAGFVMEPGNAYSYADAIINALEKLGVVQEEPAAPVASAAFSTRTKTHLEGLASQGSQSRFA